jgi:8-oxo-dGTP diphosphatase
MPKDETKGKDSRVTLAIIEDVGRVLLVKRAREPFSGFWSFPGGVGAFSSTDDPKEAVKIEVKGDIGCVFEPGSLRRFTQKTYNEASLFVFAGRISGTPVPNKGYVSEAGWFSVQDARKMELAFEQNKVLDAYLGGREGFESLS